MSLEFRRRMIINSLPADIIINRAWSDNDGYLMDVIYAQGWSESKNYMTKSEAEKVQDIGTIFNSNKSITDFSAFKYFTSVKEVKNSAFGDCFGLKYISFPNSIEKFGDGAFSRNQALVSPLIFPASTKSIGSSFLTQNSVLEEVVLNEGLETIGGQAFSSANKVKSIFIPKTVKSIGGHCINATCVVEVDSENPYYDSRDNCNAIIKTSSNTLTSGNTLTKFVEGIEEIAYWSMNGSPSIIHMPSTLKSIRMQAFSSIASIKEVYLNEGLKTIDSYAFSNCGNMTVFNFPTTLTGCMPNAITGTPFYRSLSDGLLYINDWVWTYKNSANNTNIDVIVENGYTRLGDFAFDGNFSFIKSLDLPDTLTTIGIASVRGLSKVERIIIRSNTMQFNNSYVSSVNKNCVFYVPDDRMNYYSGLISGFVMEPLSSLTQS